MTDCCRSVSDVYRWCWPFTRVMQDTCYLSYKSFVRNEVPLLCICFFINCSLWPFVVPRQYFCSIGGDLASSSEVLSSPNCKHLPASWSVPPRCPANLAVGLPADGSISVQWRASHTFWTVLGCTWGAPAEYPAPELNMEGFCLAETVAGSCVTQMFVLFCSASSVRRWLFQAAVPMTPVR